MASTHDELTQRQNAFGAERNKLLENIIDELTSSPVDGASASTISADPYRQVAGLPSPSASSADGVVATAAGPGTEVDLGVKAFHAQVDGLLQQQQARMQKLDQQFSQLDHLAEILLNRPKNWKENVGIWRENEFNQEKVRLLRNQLEREDVLASNIEDLPSEPNYVGLTAPDDQVVSNDPAHEAKRFLINEVIKSLFLLYSS